MKPRKFYIDCAQHPEVGHSARLLTGEQRWVITSRVVKITPAAPGPVIETMNTIYQPHATDESNPYELEKEHANGI